MNTSHLKNCMSPVTQFMAASIFHTLSPTIWLIVDLEVTLYSQLPTAKNGLRTWAISVIWKLIKLFEYELISIYNLILSNNSNGIINRQHWVSVFMEHWWRTQLCEPIFDIRQAKGQGGRYFGCRNNRNFHSRWVWFCLHSNQGWNGERWYYLPNFSCVRVIIFIKRFYYFKKYNFCVNILVPVDFDTVNIFVNTKLRIRLELCAHLVCTNYGTASIFIYAND